MVRVSGAESIEICDRLFRPRGTTPLADAKGYTILFGDIIDSDGSSVDEVLVSIFRAPHSYTGENSVEISCHGSHYIVSRIISLLINAGARSATAGEFTQRAFLNGKLDLSQAEAVADIIASTDQATHSLAMNQMRGGYSGELSDLRSELLRLTALLELELDFSEEDVEFANRTELHRLITEIGKHLQQLSNSFMLGNVIKEGVAVAIAGEPNVGKSTLLNAILRDERAMVSDIAGTTRDVIEESIVWEGIKLRFIDTAGIRTTDDKLEQMGIERTMSSVERADIVLYVCDAQPWGAEHADARDIAGTIEKRVRELPRRDDSKVLTVINKADIVDTELVKDIIEELQQQGLRSVYISAKERQNIDELVRSACESVDFSLLNEGRTIVSNSRHYEALTRANDALDDALQGLNNNLSADLLSEDIRQVIYYIGTITGEITNDEVLGEIFSKFCIGK